MKKMRVSTFHIRDQSFKIQMSIKKSYDIFMLGTKKTGTNSRKRVTRCDRNH